ncbi:MAG: peptide chain release factor-like protein [Pirellulales bacterium]|nr:peptide chain release factor-like protein [Pirellulales bacterium]
MATVPPLHPAALATGKLLAECLEKHLRRSGPGGQHRNKVETAVQLRHQPTGVTAEAAELRSQAENKARAIFRLRVNLALAVRQPVTENAPPSKLWQSRLRAGRIAVNPGHDDFPTLLAEALDRLSASSADVKAAAEQLGCTASQLVKFFHREPRAFQLVNQWRSEKHLHRLQ